MEYHTTQYHTYHTIPYHTIPYHIILYHIIPHYIIPHHTIPYHTISYHTTPYHTSLYRIYHTIPYHTTPQIPCYTIPSNHTKYFNKPNLCFRPLNISLPENKWSHVCFMFYNKVKLQIYYNGFIHKIFNITTLIYNTASQHQNTTELPREITIKMSGTFVPAYDQLSPGVVNQSSGSNLTVTRLYVFDQSWLSASEILRLYNEPYFPIVSRNFRIGWTEFYQPKSNTNTSALVTPSKEPDLGKE